MGDVSTGPAGAGVIGSGTFGNGSRAQAMFCRPLKGKLHCCQRPPAIAVVELGVCDMEAMLPVSTEASPTGRGFNFSTGTLELCSLMGGRNVFSRIGGRTTYPCRKKSFLTQLHLKYHKSLICL